MSLSLSVKKTRVPVLFGGKTDTHALVLTHDYHCVEDTVR